VEGDVQGKLGKGMLDPDKVQYIKKFNFYRWRIKKLRRQHGSCVIVIDETNSVIILNQLSNHSKTFFTYCTKHFPNIDYNSKMCFPFTIFVQSDAVATIYFIITILCGFYSRVATIKLSGMGKKSLVHVNVRTLRKASFERSTKN